MPIQVATCASNFLWKYNTSNKKDKTLGELAQMIEQKIHLKKHELHAERGLPKNCSRLCCNYSEKYQHYSRRISNNIHDGNRVAWSLILSTFHHQTLAVSIRLDHVISETTYVLNVISET